MPLRVDRRVRERRLLRRRPLAARLATRAEKKKEAPLATLAASADARHVSFADARIGRLAQIIRVHINVAGAVDSHNVGTNGWQDDRRKFLCQAEEEQRARRAHRRVVDSSDDDVRARQGQGSWARGQKTRMMPRSRRRAGRDRRDLVR